MIARCTEKPYLIQDENHDRANQQKSWFMKNSPTLYSLFNLLNWFF